MSNKYKIKELNIFDNKDREYWNLYKDDNYLNPLRFSNGKTQEDIVREIIDLIKKGNKIIFLRGACGSGKSAIALNIARKLGKTAIVVPVKNLQKQYEEDYRGKMCVLKEGGERLKIQMITGRDNHDSLFKEGTCADPMLPDTIQIKEKNLELIREYYEMNPLIKNKTLKDIKEFKRISIAPANPYWSPIIPAEFDVQLKDSVKKRYKGLRGREFIFYHRKKGCSYYDQYQGYIDADVIIFNSSKYKIEVALDRKPETEVDIIDEADEFLDSLSNNHEINLTRLKNSIKGTAVESINALNVLEKITELIELEEKNKRTLGIDENKIFHIKDTLLIKILNLFLKTPEIEAEVYMDDSNYINNVINAAKDFADFLSDTYLTYRKYEDNLYVNLVTINLSKRLEKIISKNKAFVFMSGTIHSEKILKEIFGIDNFKIVEAETVFQGIFEIQMTGKEKDCSYRNFKNGFIKRKEYLKILDLCISKAEKPSLIHVNSFEDLPSEMEAKKYELETLTREKLLDIQSKDKTGMSISLFKKGISDRLYSTKCTRGVDFPGETCRSIVFTKYPNPNIKNTFWKILERSHSSSYWEFYKDKARREFLQRMYRALRKKDDHVFVLSPDKRVLNFVRKLQIDNLN